MKLKIVQAAAAVALAAGAVVAVPAAANASTYAPTPPPTPGPGVTAPVSTPAGIFAGGEPVSVLLSGEDANFASLGVVQSAYFASANLGSVTSSANGSVSFGIVLPDTATGTYSTTLTSPSRPQGYQVTLSADGSVLSGGAASGVSSSGGLAATGMDSGSLLGLWVGGGALVLAGGAVAVGAAVHRQRKLADA